jgi:hypothetical protein
MSKYEAWERDTVLWLRGMYGEAFKLAVRHMDESHMHIHAYVLPPDLKANELHPGVSAKRHQREAAIARGLSPKLADHIGDNAYKSALAKWQRNYFKQVSEKHGFDSGGPGLGRVTRAEWYLRKINAQAAEHL